MNKRIRTGILTAALVGGGLVGVAQVGGVANAQTDDEQVPTEQADDPPADGEDAPRPRRGRRGGLEAAAEVLGVDAEELHTQLHEGATLADVATANGVEIDAVIEAIVADAEERLAQAVADGRLTQAEADEKAAELTERVTTRVNEGRPERPEGDGEGGRRGPRGPRPGGDAPAEQPAEG